MCGSCCRLLRWGTRAEKIRCGKIKSFCHTESGSTGLAIQSTYSTPRNGDFATGESRTAHRAHRHRQGIRWMRGVVYPRYRRGGRFSGRRVNCEYVPLLPARVVSLVLSDPRRIPYLLVWQSERDGEVKEAVRLTRHSEPGPLGSLAGPGVFPS